MPLTFVPDEPKTSLTFVPDPEPTLDFIPDPEPVTIESKMANPAYIPTMEEWKEYRQGKEGSDLSMGEAWGLVKAGAKGVFQDLKGAAGAGADMLGDGDVGGIINSTLEGAARGTWDLGLLANQAGSAVLDRVPGANSEEAKYGRFVAIRKLQAMREAARTGDEHVLEGLAGSMFRPEAVDTRLAEGASYFLDPTLPVGGIGSGGRVAGRVAGNALRGAAAPVEGLGRLGNRGIEVATKAAGAAKSKVAGMLPEGSGKVLNTATGGALGVGATLNPLGAATTAGVLAAPSALQATGATMRGIGQNLAAVNTRIGPFRRILESGPASITGRAAGRLTWLDEPVAGAARLAVGGGTGALTGGVLGYLADGQEGALQGIGAGGLLGAGGAGIERFSGGVTGRTRDRAIQSDWQSWIGQQEDATANWARTVAKKPHEKARVMDLMGLLEGVTGEDVNVRILDKDAYAEVGGQTAGFVDIRGEKPTVFLNADQADAKTLAHETLHALGKLDGFSDAVADIGTVFAGKRSPDGTTISQGLYSQAELDTAFKRYRNQLPESMREAWDQQAPDAKVEELAAEYFSAFLEGKHPSFLRTGRRSGIPGATTALNALDSLLTRRSAQKLERVTGAMETRLFGDLKRSPALDSAYQTLVTARRKALTASDLAADRDAVAYTAKDLGNPEVYQMLEGMGLARTDKMGRRVLATDGFAKKANAARAADIVTRLEELPDTGAGLVATDEGFAGQWFSPEQMSAVLKSTEIPDKVKQAIQSLDTVIGEGHAANVTYGAATRKTNRGQTRYSHRIPVTNRDVVPMGLMISKAGNMRLRAVDLSKLRAKAEKAFTADSRYSDNWKSYADLKGDLLDYASALQQGTKATAEIFGTTKRNLMNRLLGARNTRGNPLLPQNFKLTERDNVWRDLRLDRLIDASPLSDQVRFDEAAYERAKLNFSPQGRAQLIESRPFGNGGKLWLNKDGFKALQLNRRSKIRLYGPRGRSMGSFKTLEDAQAKL